MSKTEQENSLTSSEKIKGTYIIVGIIIIFIIAVIDIATYVPPVTYIGVGL